MTGSAPYTGPGSASTVVFRLGALASIAALCFSHALTDAQLPTEPAARSGSVLGARMPALSADGSELAFSLHGDIWRCKASGGVAERVTAHSAYDGYPAWSPDGRWIAFSSKREGGFDVFIIPSGGGEAVRKTHHPADDLVCDWSPDGREVLFSSARLRATPDLYTVAVADGRVRRVTNDPGGARFGRYDADGKRVAYTCGRQEWWQIGYQGSARAHVKTHRLDTGATETLPDGPGYTGMTAAGRAMLFCVAAHDGQVGIRRAAWAAGAWLPVVADGADPISWLTCARSGTLVVYEKAGDLWAVDGVAAGAPRRIEIVARTDVRSMPVTTVRQTNGFSHLALSPDGKTLALAASGDLWTAPVGGGDATRLTTTRGDETWPAWSPDGKLLVFAAYRDGQVDLFLRDMAEKSERRLTNDAAIEERPLFAPGGDRIAFVRTDGPDPGLVVHYLQAPDAEPLGPETRVWQGRDIAGFDWSPDGRWLAFSATEGRGVRDIMVAPSVGGDAVNVTRAAGELRWPRWSRDGRLIACVGTLWSVSDIAEAGVVVVPLVPEVAEDGPPGSQSAGRPGPGRGEGPGGGDLSAPDPTSQRRRRPPGAPSVSPPGAEPGTPQAPWPLGPPVPPSPRVAVDFETVSERVRLAAPAPAPVRAAEIAPDGRTLIFGAGEGSEPWLAAADGRSRAGMRLGDASGVAGDIVVAPDSSAILWTTADGSVRVLRRGSAASAPIAITCTFERDRRRAVSDAMHAASREIARSVGGSPAWSAGALGQDRPSLDRYAGALAAAERIALASDAPEAVADAIRFMAARSGVWIADARVRGAEDRTGYLGVDFDADHAGPGLRIAGVLPGGPSDDIASGPTAGEYVHSIDGTPCSSGETAWAHLVGRAGREVALVVAPTAPSATEDAVAGVRTVRVRAMGREAELRLRDRAWSQEQAARVASLSSGVVKYVRVRGFDPEDVRRLAGDLRSDVGRARAFIVDLRDLDSAGDPAHALAAILDRRWSGVDDASGAGARDIPLALLVNERTIGCAEAVALAVQAAGRGALVGGQMPGFAVRTRRFDALEEVQITLADRSYTDRSGRSLVGLFTSIPGGFVREPDRQLEAAVSAALSLAHEVARPVLPR